MPVLCHSVSSVASVYDNQFLNVTVAISRPSVYVRLTAVLESSGLGMLWEVSARREILLQPILVGAFSSETQGLYAACDAG